VHCIGFCLAAFLTALLLLVGPCSCFQSEERRSRALQPYLVSTPKRGVIGNSKYADRLRRQVGDGRWLAALHPHILNTTSIRSHVCAAVLPSAA
jgi:hypothetical protein